VLDQGAFVVTSSRRVIPPPERQRGPGGTLSSVQAGKLERPQSTPGACYLACGSECTKTCPQAAIARIPEETRKLLVECGNERVQHLAVRYYGLPDHVRAAVKHVLIRHYGVARIALRDDVAKWELDLADSVLAVAEASAA